MAATALGRSLTRRHRQAQVALSGRFLAAGRLLLGEINPARIDDTLADWAGLQTALTETAWNQSRDLAAEYLTAYRVAEVGRAGASMPLVTDLVFDSRAAALDALWLGPVAKGRIGGGDTALAALRWAFDNNVGLSEQRRILDGGRSVIDRSAIANPASHGWRRVADGNPCSFCQILVTRGPVYSSPEAAGQGRRYHDRCGCTVEEVFGAWTPDKQEQEWIDAYEAAHRPGDSIEDTANRMGTARSAGGGRNGGTDHTAIQGGSSGGRNGGGRRRSVPSPGGPPEDRDWADRVRALGIDVPDGEHITEAEYQFVERFTETHTITRWIPRDRRKWLPTNDFVWADSPYGPIEIELKSTKAKYKTITNHFRSDWGSVRLHGIAPVKQDYIVDIGEAALTPKLHGQLIQYNVLNPRSPIRRLWVMSRGRITRIPLK